MKNITILKTQKNTMSNLKNNHLNVKIYTKMSSKMGHEIEAPLKNAFLTSKPRHEGNSTLELESPGVNCISQAFSSCFKGLTLRCQRHV